MKDQNIIREVDNYYTEKLRAFGPTHLGVDWNSQDSQSLRFEQLTKVLPEDTHNSLLDYGCGYGALIGFLKEKNFDVDYCGLDVSASMIAEARKKYIETPKQRFIVGESVEEKFDFSIASGIFNVKMDFETSGWEKYIVDTLNRINQISLKGFSFNMLTLYSDVEKRRGNLHYADPCKIFDLCKRNFSFNVALLHDYGLYEFTILVRK